MSIKRDAADIIREDGPDALREAFDRAAEQQRQYNGQNGPDHDPRDDEVQTPAAVRQLLPFINMSNWDNEQEPIQEWTVHNRIPNQQCVLCSGVGGAGKSTTWLHLSCAHVLSRDWLGTMPRPGPALFVDAEDSEDVIHRRLGAITRHYGVKYADLITGGLHLISLFGRDAILATVSRGGKMEPTQLFKQLLEAAGDIKPAMTTIAASANVFAGSEIDRSQVQQSLAC
jgi:RecA-family ATPase